METLLEKIKARKPLVGAAVGSGLTAQAAAGGGADFLMVLNAGYFRVRGCSSVAALMPYGNANMLSWELATLEILPRIDGKPVILGVCAQDPALDVDDLCRRAREAGIIGLTNFPSVGFIDGAYREALEENGLGYGREVALLEAARRHGLLTIGFCLSPEEAGRMAQAGVDLLCLDLGFAEWRGVEPAKHQADLDRAVELVQAMMAAARRHQPRPHAVVFGGPVLLPQDSAQIYQRTEAKGYVGGSTMERHPASAVISQTVREFRNVAEAGASSDRLGALLGRSPAMRRLFETIHRVARSDAPVLLVGESGTGKELAAREIHRLSRRHARPLVSWNCGATTESLATSELFGHEKGAFTGAARAHRGMFEAAQDGTLFMDEVADLPLSVQAGLLRVIQEKEFVRVGGEERIDVNARLIAASNQDLRSLIPSGRFRLDLYFRLSTVTLHIPPLRDRREDIPLIVWELSQEFSREYGVPAPRIPPATMDLLLEHAWPGNIRELRNVVERAFILCGGDTVALYGVQEALRGGPELVPAQAPDDLKSKRARLMPVLRSVGGNKAAAARTLGVTRRTIYAWLASCPNLES